MRLSGTVFEAISALVQRRPSYDLYHSALVITVPEGRFVIEQTPVPDTHGERRGVVEEGPVGTRFAGRFRLFRYEILGRDERHAGEMWNSNSVIAWLLARTGIDAGTIHPPAGGRAPGWRAGLVVATRDELRDSEAGPARRSQRSAPHQAADVRLRNHAIDCWIASGRGVAVQPNVRSNLLLSTTHGRSD